MLAKAKEVWAAKKLKIHASPEDLPSHDNALVGMEATLSQTAQPSQVVEPVEDEPVEDTVGIHFTFYMQSRHELIIGTGYANGRHGPAKTPKSRCTNPKTFSGYSSTNHACILTKMLEPRFVNVVAVRRRDS